MWRFEDVETYCPGSRAGPAGGAGRAPKRRSSAARPGVTGPCGPWEGSRCSGGGAFCAALDSSGTKPGGQGGGVRTRCQYDSTAATLHGLAHPQNYNIYKVQIFTSKHFLRNALQNENLGSCIFIK